MKVAIMQPYFFPYLGYFSLIKHTDRFILLDEVQFIRHGWIERNRILKPDNGWQYFSVPLIKHTQQTAIKDIQINNTEDWKRKIIAQLSHYKKKAPYYNTVINLLNNIFSEEHTNITSLNKSSVIHVCKELGLNKDIEIFSDMGLNIDRVNAPDEWALNICKGLGNVDEYWNPPGGKAFFSQQKYALSGISLKFHSVILKEYNQKRNNFEPGLSIIDVMMFNSVEEIAKMLDDYELF
jgi:hypothetical protein